MRLLFLLSLLLLLFPARLYPQQKARAIGDLDALVSLMKEKKHAYEKIENEAEGGSYKHSFFEGKQLRLVSVQDSGKIIKRVDWYFENGSLIYTETLWIDGSGATLFLEKTYHGPKGMIAWIRSESSFVDSNSPEFIKLDKELSAYSQKLQEDALK